eukprot:800725_1
MNYLWIFGGDGSFATSSNERVNVSNIAHNSWHYVDPSYVYGPMHGTRCAAWHDVIYIVGGMYWADPQQTYDRYIGIVYIVDAETGTINVSAHEMPNTMGYTSPIIVGDVLYTFGGTRNEKW